MAVRIKYGKDQSSVEKFPRILGLILMINK
jgi:hypothetical protein